MNEIEIGARINFEEIEEKLIALGARRKREEKQTDTFCRLAHRDLGRHEVVRLRERGGEAEITYKEPVEKSGGVIARQEVSFKASIKEGKMFLRALGAKPWIIVNKNRQIYKFKDFNIGLDCVEGLGDFIEVELVGLNKMIARKRILCLIEKLGIEECSLMEKPYYLMLLEKNKNK
ncbi:class IV adenylate cyclase [Nanoarchaeota archaeon]